MPNPDHVQLSHELHHRILGPLLLHAGTGLQGDLPSTGPLWMSLAMFCVYQLLFLERSQCEIDHS